jgi:hypothetical protein
MVFMNMLNANVKDGPVSRLELATPCPAVIMSMPYPLLIGTFSNEKAARLLPAGWNLFVSLNVRAS